MSHAGRFVWRELITPNTEAAVAFYTGLFGWESATMAMPGGAYTLFKQGEEDVGGTVAPPMANVPSHWMDYITVDDVDASLAVVEKAGGKAITAAMDLPVGRFAVVADPTGAVFALFKGSSPGATDTDRQPPVGTFCWSHLRSSNADAVIPFYSKLFGWQPTAGEMPFFTRNGAPVCSVEQLPAGDPTPSHWLQYVAVDDADAAHAKAEGLGAKTLAPPTTMTGMGRFAVVADPAGAVVAVWKNLGAGA